MRRFIDKGVAAPLVVNLGPARLSLFGMDGRCRVARRPAPLRTLVLSGGGAKGVAYAGAIAALARRRVLPGIREVWGASAGAAVGALLACGMSANALTALIDRLDLQALLAGKGDPLDTPVSLHRLPVWLFRLFGSGKPLYELVRHHSRAALLARLDDWLARAASRTAGYCVVSRLRQRVGRQDEPLTFLLLAEASLWVPALKRFACSVSFRARRGALPQWRILDAVSAPDVEIARAVQASCALPFLFRPVWLDVPTAPGDYFDGGCTLNTPSPSLLAPADALTAFPDGGELVFLFEPPSKRRWLQAWLGKLFDWASGTASATASAWLRAQLARPVTGRQVVQIPLRLPQGDYTTATTRLTLRQEERGWLRDSARLAVARFWRGYRRTREWRDYDSVFQALLAMRDADFSRLLRHGLAGREHEALASAAMLRERVAAALREVCQSPAGSMGWHHLEALLVPLDDGDDADRRRYLFDRLHRLSCRAARQTLDLALFRPPAARSRLERGWLVDQERRVVRRLTWEIERQWPYPAARRLARLSTLPALQHELESLLGQHRADVIRRWRHHDAVRQAERWIEEIRRLRQGRGHIWSGVTTFAQQTAGNDDM